MYVSIYFNPVGINIIYHKRTSPNKYYTLFRLCCSNGLELLKAIIVNSSELWKLWSTSIENGTNSLQNKYISVRGHPKMSTFSWVYKQYTFSDPLSPSFPLSLQTNIFGFKIWVSCITFITQQQKLTLLSSLFEMIALAKYYDLQISVNSVYFQI